jgi:multisubunit Na+/H+ antiporter MnhC subunit
MKKDKVSWLCILLGIGAWYILSDAINETISSLGVAGTLCLVIIYQLGSLREKLLPKEESEEEIEEETVRVKTSSSKSWFEKTFEGLDS